MDFKKRQRVFCSEVPFRSLNEDEESMAPRPPTPPPWSPPAANIEPDRS